MNGLPHDFSLPGRANSLCPLRLLDTTLQIAHHVEELTRSRMQSLLCAGAYPVEEFTPLLSTFCARSDSAQDYTPLLSSPYARVYSVEECTPLLSLLMRKSLLCAQTHTSQFTTFSRVHRFNACHVSRLTNKVNTLRLEFTPCGVYPFCN